MIYGISTNSLNPPSEPPVLWRHESRNVWLIQLPSKGRVFDRPSIVVRIACFIVDLLVAGGVASIAFAVPFVLIVSLVNEEFVPNQFFVALLWASFVAYWVVCYHVWGRTLGMRFGRLYVFDKQTGVNLSWWKSTLRAIVLLISFPIPFGSLIWWIVAGTNEWRQGPHDYASGSVVVGDAF